MAIESKDSPVQSFVNWTTAKGGNHPLYSFEPWNGPDGVAPRHTPGGAKFQKSCQLSTKYMRMSVAANQDGKTYDRAIEAVIMMTGELPYALRVPDGVDTGVPRSIDKQNIIRWGRRDKTTKLILDHNFECPQDGTWDCGNITGVGVYPMVKICREPGQQVWVCTYKQARNDTWVDLFNRLIPEHCLDKSHGTNGFSKSEYDWYLLGNHSIRMKTYDQGWERVEAFKAWHIILDEEPPDRKYYTGCVLHAHTLSFSFTPLRGMCFDEATEILTNNGWRSWNTVSLGDQIVTWDNGEYRYAPCENLYLKPVSTGLMKRITGKGMDALVTENHRWKVKFPSGLYHVVETSQLKKTHRIPSSGEFKEWGRSDYPDDFFTMLGWYLSEGTNKNFHNIVISQNETRYPKNCDEIRATLNRLGELGHERTLPYKKLDGTTSCQTYFRWGGTLASKARELGKSPDESFLMSISEGQARLLFDAMNKGDGCRINGGSDNWKYSTCDLKLAKFYQTLCILLGYSSSMVSEKITWKCGKYGPTNKLVYRIYVSRRSFKQVDTLDIRDELYSGRIWCVSTKVGTVVARRDGKIYVSGNSWVFSDLYEAWRNGSPDIDVFHATKYDSPYAITEEVERQERLLKGYEREPKIYGNFAAQEGKPYYDWELCKKYLEDYVPIHKYATILPIQPCRNVMEAVKLRMHVRVMKEKGDAVGAWEIYEDVRPDTAYWMPADCGRGHDDPDQAQDSSAAYIFRHPREGESQEWPVCVAALHSTELTENFAWLSLYGAIQYNCATIIPETKGEDGSAYFVELRDYPFWFKMTVVSDKTKRTNERIGFDTNVKTRTPLFNKLRKYINAHEEKSNIPHYALLLEMSKIIWLKGRPDHPENGTSDCTVAFCLGLWMWEEAPFQIHNNSKWIKREMSSVDYTNFLLTERRKRETKPVLGTSRGMDSRKRGSLCQQNESNQQAPRRLRSATANSRTPTSRNFETF